MPGPPSTPGTEAQTFTVFDRIVAGATGLEPRVVATWRKAENGPANNPLNIMDPATKKPKSYATPEAAAHATATLLLTDKRYAGVIRSAADAPTNPLVQLNAIAASPWDQCNYRGTNPDGSCVNASQGALLRGVFASSQGGGGIIGDVTGAIGGAVGGVTGAIGDLWGGVTSVPGAIEAGVKDTEKWAANAAIVALAYLVLTVGALALVLLGLMRATGVSPGDVAGMAASRGATAGGKIPF